MHRRPIIGVMGSHTQSWEEYATPLGRLIAEHDFHLLTGAGPGVMTAVSKAFFECEDRAGKSIGIVPTVDYTGQYVPRDEYPNPYIEIPIITPLDKRAQGDANPYSRNHVNVMTSSAIVFLPGEHGTMNEAGLAIQYHKPMIFFGPEEEFERFPEQATRVEDVAELIEFLESVRPKIHDGEGDK